VWILQVSDIHLSAAERAGVDRGRFLAMMGEAVDATTGDRGQLVVCICGDITSKGNPAGYDLAATFFREMRVAFGPDTILCPCPGNHDIVADGAQRFDHFNRFSWSLTRDEDVFFSPERSVVRRSIGEDNASIVVVNSAHHGDYSYGLVDLDQMEAVLQDVDSKRSLVVVTHHHCIPIRVDDRSTTANACGFLELALAYNATAILHGHTHRGTILSIGKRNCTVIGVGSLFFRPAPNFNNQFNLLECEDGVVVRALAYRFIGDLRRRGREGSFDLKKLEVL